MSSYAILTTPIPTQQDGGMRRLTSTEARKLRMASGRSVPAGAIVVNAGAAHIGTVYAPGHQGRGDGSRNLGVTVTT